MCYALIFLKRFLNPILWLVQLPLKCVAIVLTRQRLPNIFTFLLLYATTLIFVYALCQHLPYSVFYHFYGAQTLNYARIKDVNNQRRFNAKQVLSELDASATRAMYLENSKSEHLRYVIGVVTVNRQVYRKDVGPLDYLTQVMAQLHHVLAKNHATGKVFPFMCNVDTNPESHKEALLLGHYFPNVTKLYSPLYSSSQSHRMGGVENREKQDYVFCLQAAMEYKADYVIIVEDDAYPNDDFYQVMEHLIETKLESKIERGDSVDNQEKWGWVKLMIPYSLTRYHRNVFFFCQWIALALLTSGILCLFFELYIKYVATTNSYCFKNCQTRQSSVSSILTLMLAFIYFLMIIWIIGRPYYVQMRTFSPYLYALEPGTSCCTQAVLYKPAEIPGILDYLRKISCSPSFPLDFALDNYRKDNMMRQYLVSPNIFSHIGFYSSIHQSFNKNEAEFI